MRSMDLNRGNVIGRLLRSSYRGLVGAVSLLAAWRDTYSPIVLLGFDESSGGTAFDSSGNNNDLAWTAAPTAMGQPGIFSKDELSVDLSATGWGTFDHAHTVNTKDMSFVCSWRSSGATNKGYVLYLLGPDFVLSQSRSGGVEFYDGAFRAPTHPFTMPVGDRFLVGYSFGALSSSVYINGIRVSDMPASAIGNSFTTGASYGAGPIGNLPSYGDHALSMLFAGETGETTHYQLWKDVTGGQLHYWYETLGSLSGAGAGFDDSFDDSFSQVNIPPSSIVFHAPLWEEAGAQAIDVSGNGNHGAYVGLPLLGQPPLNDQAVYSIGLSGAQYVNSGNTVNIAADDITVSIQFSTSGSGRDCLFSIASTTANYLAAEIYDASPIRIRLDDGTTVDELLVAGAYRDGLPHTLTVRLDNTSGTIDAWVDGVKATGISITATVAATAVVCGFGGAAVMPTGYSPIVGNISPPTIANVALSDADCALL